MWVYKSYFRWGGGLQQGGMGSLVLVVRYPTGPAIISQVRRYIVVFAVWKGSACLGAVKLEGGGVNHKVAVRIL